MKNEQTQQLNLSNSKDKGAKSKSKQRPFLDLTVSTWTKQSHGLYDYQSPPEKIYKEELKIEESSRVIRNTLCRRTLLRSMKDQVKDIADRIEIFNLQLNPKTKSFLLKNSLSTQLDTIMLARAQQNQTLIQKHKLFVVLEPNGQGHKLEIGDFIKLGRVELVVLQINDAKKTDSLDFQQVYGSKQYIFHLKEQLEGACKICLSDQATQQDPLVNPCNCKGSCGVIHLECLKNWVNNKVKKDVQRRVKTYSFEKFSCEICKAPFPSIIKLENGNQIMLLNFQRPTTPYVLVEQLSQSQQKVAKTLHFILQEQGQRVHIGRGGNCELGVSDISVSRIHSYVTYVEGNFFIHDAGSKFGTLVELKHELTLHKKTKVRLQHYGCILTFQEREKEGGALKRGKKSVDKRE